jgi:hypothetical protein
MDKSWSNQPSIKQQVTETKSVVNQTWEDLNDMGGTLDKALANVEGSKKILQKLFKHQLYIEEELKKTIAFEVEKQIAPLREQIDLFVSSKSKVIYLKPKAISLNIFKKVYNLFRRNK